MELMDKGIIKMIGNEHFKKDLKERNNMIHRIRETKFEKGYKPKHPILFDYHNYSEDKKVDFLKKYIHPDMYWAEKKEEWNYILKEPIWEVYQFPLFTKEFCKMLVEELENFNWFITSEVENFKNFSKTS